MKNVNRCCEKHCQNRVAGKDNYRCLEHSRAYYAPWLYHQVLVEDLHAWKEVERLKDVDIMHQ